MRFDIEVTPGGYTWWYIDAISDDGRHALTIIAFIGSVFSPYYAWSGRQHPFDHCALNVALYEPRQHHWTMTERGADLCKVSAEHFQIGPSALHWREGSLLIDIDEKTTPFPSPVKGTVRVVPDFINQETFQIDDAGQHHWRPIAPLARVDVDIDQPGVNWTGRGYLDTNIGTEPLESAFDYWDWSRLNISDDRTAILYNCDMRNGASRSLALDFRQGGVAPFEKPPESKFASTPVWRIKRRTFTDTDRTPKLVRTLEDTPFYSRSEIENTIAGKTAHGVHESFSGTRLRRQLVKAMLPFRMPRRTR